MTFTFICPMVTYYHKQNTAGKRLQHHFLLNLEDEDRVNKLKI